MQDKQMVSILLHYLNLEVAVQKGYIMIAVTKTLGTFRENVRGRIG